ncbi:hypothetical protein QUA30_28000 [Microcoleus sp. Pol14C2]|uniref:hypothetical protein n=1 Tax=unclassified Microcoleus TaxID=2642155 RepID=UPI002FCF2A74
MPLSADCPNGRSQLFTFKAKETVVVDRLTLEHILFLLRNSRATCEYLSGNSIFVVATKTYLASLDSGESRKAINLLDIWEQTAPEALEELDDSLDKALQSVEFILAAAAGGKND